MKNFCLYLHKLLVALFQPARILPLWWALRRWADVAAGQNVRVVTSAKFNLANAFAICARIRHEVLVAGSDAPVRTGKCTSIAPTVTLITGTHKLFGLTGKAARRGYSQPTTITEEAWLGRGVTAQGGLAIGRKLFLLPASSCAEMCLP